MELKYGKKFDNRMRDERSNRTFMELKLPKSNFTPKFNTRSNRTFMELKSPFRYAPY